MGEPDGSYWKSKLIPLLSDAESESREVRAKAQEVVETTTVSGSLASHLRTVLSDAPNDSVLPESDWRNLYEDWQAYRNQLGNLFVAAASSSTTTATGQAATLTTAMSEQHFSGWVTKPGRAALDEVRAIIHRPTLLQDAIALLDGHGIAGFSGERSPQALLEEAHGALARPSGQGPNATAVLLTARSAVNGMLAALLPRRTTQEKARKPQDKVESLGRQLGLARLDAGHFNRLGARAEELVDSLSGGKGKSLDASEVSRRLDQALNFIIAFLSSLDVEKTKV